MTLIEQWIEQGHEKGLKKGREEGLEKGREEGESIGQIMVYQKIMHRDDYSREALQDYSLKQLKRILSKLEKEI